MPGSAPRELSRWPTFDNELVPAAATSLNLNVRGIGSSATLAINEESNCLRAEGRIVYRLGLGQSPFPVPETVVESLRANAHQKSYLAVRGLPALREAVADYHRRRRQHFECTANDVLIGPGSKELMFLLQLCYYGDLVIPTPSWVSYAPQAHILGRHVRWLRTDAANHWRLTASELDALCRDDPDRPRLVILNYPSNPSGITYLPDQLEELAQVAERYGVVLCSDEIYGELHHQGRHVSIARYYPTGTIISSGLSKWCGAGGWRLGTMTFPPGQRRLLDAMASVASETFTSTSSPIQYAAVTAFLPHPSIERYLVQARRILAALGLECARRLREAGVRVHDPEGGFYLFPDFEPHRETLRARGVETSSGLCQQLLHEAGVAALPGSAFGRPQDELGARLAYVDFDGASALVAAESVPLDRPLPVQFLEDHCGPVLRAIRLLKEWLSP